MSRLARDERTRSAFMACCLEKLGLEISNQDTALPTLTSLHLSAVENSTVTELLCSWEESMDKEDGQEYIKGEMDTFRIRNKDGCWDLGDLKEALPNSPATELDAHGVPDYTAMTKDIIAHEKSLPDFKMTPRFDHKVFYSSLKQFQQIGRGAESWGNVLLYGDVVTSTNSLLEKLVITFYSLKAKLH